MKTLLGFAFWATLFVVIAFVVAPYFLPNVPEGSPTFDCDDSTLYMYDHFTERGQEVQAIAGNLDLIGEQFEETNHIWLMVKFGDTWIPYDWGYPCFDDQHYEGFDVTYELLCEAVEADKKKGEK